MQNFSVAVRQIFNSAPQIRLLSSLAEVVELVPALQSQRITKAAPLCLVAENGETLRFEGYPTGSLVNQDPAMTAKLLRLLGSNEEVEFEVKGTLSLGKPAARSAQGRSVVKVQF